MRIQTIPTNYYGRSNASHKNYSRQQFQGKINNHEYSDRIISLAKKYINDPNWERKMKDECADFAHNYSTWHYNMADEGAKGMRILAGVLTLGATEVIMAGVTAAQTAVNSAFTEFDINEIKKCIEDLRKAGN